MYNFYYNLRYIIKSLFKIIFKKNKIDLSSLNEPLSAEEEAEIDIDVDEYWERMPSLIPNRTALFTTFAGNYNVNIFDEFLFCRKINHDCKLLLEIGYDVFVVNRGNEYGMLAMQELLRMKHKGFEFKLYCINVRGEHNTILIDPVQRFFQMCECDDNFRTLFLYEFIKYVIRCVTVISTEEHLFLSHGKIPRTTYDYYKSFKD